MPTYEYECSACGHQFEEFQSIKAKPTVVCPKCKKRKVKRLISAGGGFIFKGSGFYITDYRSDKYKEAAKNDVAADCRRLPPQRRRRLLVRQPILPPLPRPQPQLPLPLPAKSEPKSSSKKK